MKPTEMKARCAACKHYRLINYGEDHYGIGCMKATVDGVHPVDIITLERCPRSHTKKRFNPVEAAELMPILGQIYGKTAAADCFLPLHEMLRSGGPTVRRKSQYVGKALVEMGILKVISRSEKGYRGTRCTYRWDVKKYGPPSLDMVDKINSWLQDCNERLSARKYQKAAEVLTRRTEQLLVDKGVTVCEQCWMRDTPDCYARVRAMGLDCKEVNINSIRYAEARLG